MSINYTNYGLLKKPLRLWQSIFLIFLFSMPVFSPNAKAQEKPLPGQIQPEIKDSLKLDFKQVIDNELISPDSSVYKIFARNSANWRKILIVADWTGSMYPYGLQVLIWLKQNSQIKDRVNAFVFFNDGDDKPLGEKIIGQTGGVYFTDSQDFNEIIQTMEKTRAGGMGGDSPENNLEALLTGQFLCPDCQDIILLADSESLVRDIELLPILVKNCETNFQNLRIILCGAERGVNSDYLQIAYAVNGSIHTLEQDWEYLKNMPENQVLKLGPDTFELEDGIFKIVPPKKKK
jgi:hypothetical protein